jgi:hypothetical protein
MEALTLATGLLVIGAGCGTNKAGSEKSDKKDAPPVTTSIPNTNPASTTPAAGSNSNPVPPPLPDAEKIDLNVGVGKDALDVLRALRDSTFRADQLSLGFVKAIGLPVTFPADKEKGYSPDAAEGLLRRAVSLRNLSLPYMSKQVGDVALFRGTFIGNPGGYCLRMIHEGGAWKVDWLSLSSIEIQGNLLNSSKADTVNQEFAVAAIIGTLLDKNAMSREDRAVLLAAGLTPALKARWAEPLASDKAEGFDYNRGLLAQKAEELCAGADSMAPVQQGNSPDFRVEVTRPGGKATYSVKLVNGRGPSHWLVDDMVLLK